MGSALQIESVELTRHPLMCEEELLAGRLLELFTAYKRRQASNALQFYSDRLLGLEDALLDTRHKLLNEVAVWQLHSALAVLVQCHGVRGAHA